VQLKKGDEERIDLKKHIGMNKPVTPGFGFPVIRFQENPIEKYQSQQQNMSFAQIS
jgi:hypothetical protein